MRTWTLAGLCALWVVSWPMLLLESTRGLPGLLDLSRDRGAYDLVALVYRGPDVVPALSLFLAALRVFLHSSQRFEGLVGQCLLIPLLLPMVFAEQRLLFVAGLRGVLGPDVPAVDGVVR